MPRPATIVVAFLLAALVPAVAHASRIKVSPYRNGVSIVSVSGPLETGDGDRFAMAVAGVGKALVALNADGGDVASGIAVGNEVRARGLGTLVGAKARCEDACALAWLGGARRYLEQGAKVAFGPGAPDPSAIGYLEGLRLSDEALAFVVGTGGPRVIDEDMAERLGLEIERGESRRDVSDASVAKAIARAAGGFRAAYGEVGISGIQGNIRDCYVALGKDASLDRVAYCHAMDRIAQSVDVTVSASLGFEPQEYLSRDEVLARVEGALAGIGVPASERRSVVREMDARTDAAFAKVVSAGAD